MPWISFLKYLFIWLYRVFVVAFGILQHAGSNSLWHVRSSPLGWNPGPLHWEWRVSHWTTREVPSCPEFHSRFWKGYQGNSWGVGRGDSSGLAAPKATVNNMHMNGRGCVLIKLYLQKQAGAGLGPQVHSLPTSAPSPSFCLPTSWTMKPSKQAWQHLPHAWPSLKHSWCFCISFSEAVLKIYESRALTHSLF